MSLWLLRCSYLYSHSAFFFCTFIVTRNIFWTTLHRHTNMTENLVFSKVISIPSTFSGNSVYFYKDADDRLVIGLTDKDALTVHSTHTSTSIANRTLTTLNDLIGKSNGIAGLDPDAKIHIDNIPDEFTKPCTSLNGPKIAAVNTTINYTIAGYSTFDVYTVTATAGSISVSGNTVTYTTPSTPQAVTLYLNSLAHDVDITPTGTYITTPRITSPTAGSTQLPSEVMFTSTPFTVASGTDTHVSSSWQISTDTDFANIISTSIDDTSNLLTYSVSGLAADTVYYSRVRHTGSTNGQSNWSPSSHFITKKQFLSLVEISKLTAEYKYPDAQYGRSITTDANSEKVAIGAPDKNTNTYGRLGSVYTYKRYNKVWTQTTILTHDSLVTNDAYGLAVVMSKQGNRLAIGAPGSDLNTDIKGRVFIYTYTNSDWVLEDIISPTNSSNGDRFGRSLAITDSGDRVIIGGLDIVSVYKRDGVLWNHEYTDSNPGTDYGKSVATDSIGSRLAGGAISGNGSVRVLLRDGTSWSLEQTLVATVTISDSLFGHSLSMDANGTVIAIGSPFDVISSVKSGSVSIATRVGTTWTVSAAMNGSDSAEDDIYGTGIAISASGDMLVVGAPATTVSTIPKAGTVYRYVKNGTSWIESNRINASDMNSNDLFGFSIAMSDNRVFVGSILSDVEGTMNAGATYVYY